MYALNDTDSGATTWLAQNTPSEHTDQDVSGYRVRRMSGAQSTNGRTRLRSGPGVVPCGTPAFLSSLLVMANKIRAVIRSATKTRSTRPRRSRGERGVGGSVTPAATVAAIWLLMPELAAIVSAIRLLTPELAAIVFAIRLLIPELIPPA